MYRGITPPLLGVTPIFAISFWGYDVGKRIVYAATPSRTTQTLSIGELAVAGGISAIPATLVAGPAERVKVLLQVSLQFTLRALVCISAGLPNRQILLPATLRVSRLQAQVQGQGGSAAYSGPIDVVRKLYAEGGLRSIFRGTAATLARDGPGSAV